MRHDPHEVSTSRQAVISQPSTQDFDQKLRSWQEELHSVATRLNRFDAPPFEGPAYAALEPPSGHQLAEDREHLRSEGSAYSARGQAELSQLQAKMSAAHLAEYTSLRKEADEFIQNSISDNKKQADAQLEHVVREARSHLANESETIAR